MTDGDENPHKGGLPGGDHQMAKNCVPSTSTAAPIDPPPYSETAVANGSTTYSHQSDPLPSYTAATRQAAIREKVYKSITSYTVRIMCDKNGPKGYTIQTEAAKSANTEAIALPDFGPEQSSTNNSAAHTVVSSGPPLDENNHRYVGLVNQAMTCYLNSLIQTLYMTPEFRNSIYKWEYNGKDKLEDRSIPYQIQKLFLLLQTSDKDSLETKELTSSFGWQSAEAYDQHDVQELCRLMFDALEHKWKNTAHEKLIQDLYRGSMEDFVKCLTCGKENTRKDYFLDLPLAVREFGVTQAFRSVEEALSAFVRPETLDGNNQYFCEACNSKQDAHKGLRITQFPYLLTIQLKRFDFDYTTMHRIKLNDKMTFPDVLNLNPFLGDRTHKTDDDRDLNARAGEAINRKEVEEIIETEGEYVYELFSVMVHAGSAAGGHYFAYIKNMDQQSWYCFNDSRVDYCNSDDIMRSFGNSGYTWSNSNANAYMLMYRKIDKRNQNCLRTNELPEHIVNLLIKWKKEEEDRERKQRYEASLVKVCVQLNMHGLSDWRCEKTYQKSIHRDETLSHLLDEAFLFYEDQLRGSTQIHRKNSRLLKCSNNWAITGEFTNKSQLQDRLEQHIPYYTQQVRPELFFLLDMKAYNSAFYKIDFPNSGNDPKTYRVHCIDVVQEVIASVFFIAIAYKDSAIQIKQKIGQVLGVKEHEFCLFRLWTEKRAYAESSFVSLANNDVPCAAYSGFGNEPGYFFIDGGTGFDSTNTELIEDRKKPMQDSKMLAILERRKFSTKLYIELPTADDIQKASQSSPVSATIMGAEPAPETHQALDTPLSVGTAATDDPMSAAPSGRASSTSSVDAEDLMSMDSPCNNTPQMSPNVSENGDNFLSGDENDIGNTGLNNILMKSWTATTPINSGIYMTPPATETDTQAATVGESDSSSVTMVPWQIHRDRFIIDVEEENRLQLDVDKRVLVLKLKEWIGNRIGMDPKQFVLLKHHEENDNGYECSPNSEASDTIEQAFKSVQKISVLLRPPLKENERLIHVSLFSLDEMDREKWKTLFEIPASKETIVGNFLEECRRLYLAQYGENIPLERLRLRSWESSFKTSAMVCLPNDAPMERRGQQWVSKVYLQIIPEELVGLQGESIFVRHFKPSTMELGPFEELIVDSNTWPDPNTALKDAISRRSGILVDNIELVEPTVWDKWPFIKPRIDLLEKSDWKSSLGNGDNCLSMNHGKVLYYRDSQEEPKKLTVDERKQISIKDRTVGSQTTRRHERPLRINMNSISEQ